MVHAKITGVTARWRNEIEFKVDMDIDPHITPLCEHLAARSEQAEVSGDSELSQLLRDAEMCITILRERPAGSA